MTESELPDWLHALAERSPRITVDDMPFGAQGAQPARPGSVLLLFGDGLRGPDLLFIERAATMRSHAGQPAFPGGAQDPGDADPVAAALREAQEEVGLRADSVEVFGTLPTIHLRPSGYVVTPVLAWWRTPHDVRPVDAAEVASVERIAIADLVDPVNRCAVGRREGRNGPAFQVHGLLVWGFTAYLTDRVLEWGGWALPWLPEPMLDVPAAPAPPVTD